MEFREFMTTDAAALDRTFWSRGIPALDATPRPPRREAMDPSEMTLDELKATQAEGSNMPSMAREAWLAGVSNGTLDHHIGEGDDACTLADTIAAPVVESTGYVTAMPLEAMTPEQHAAYKSFVAKQAEVARDPVVYTTPDPAIRQRIEWERHRHAAGDVKRYGVRPNAAGTSMEFYALVGRRLNRRDFLAAKYNWLVRFFVRTGLREMPSPSDFATKREAVHYFRDSATAQGLIAQGRAVMDAVVDILGSPEEDDEAAETSREFVDEPYIPAYATLRFILQAREDETQRIAGAARIRWPHWSEAKRARMVRDRISTLAGEWFQSLTDAADAEEPVPMVAFRSTRDATAYRLAGGADGGGLAIDAFRWAQIADPDVAPFLIELGYAD